jgi:hypothetical protein
MRNLINTAEIIDLDSFRQQKQQSAAAENNKAFTPMLVWCPVWVLVPSQPTPTG